MIWGHTFYEQQTLLHSFTQLHTTFATRPCIYYISRIFFEQTLCTTQLLRFLPFLVGLLFKRCGALLLFTTPNRQCATTRHNEITRQSDTANMWVRVTLQINSSTRRRRRCHRRTFRSVCWCCRVVARCACLAVCYLQVRKRTELWKSALVAVNHPTVKSRRRICEILYAYYNNVARAKQNEPAKGQQLGSQSTVNLLGSQQALREQSGGQSALVRDFAFVNSSASFLVGLLSNQWSTRRAQQLSISNSNKYQHCIVRAHINKT